MVGSNAVIVGALGGLGLETLLGLTVPERALAVVAVITLLGLGMLRWDASFLDRSVDAATERPLASVLYGVAAHLAIAFAGVMLTAKLGRMNVGDYFVGWLGVAAGVGLLLVTAMVGFSVVGAVLVSTVTDAHPGLAVVVGAVIAGAVTLLDPLVGTATWLVVVSAGIGGSTRRWFTADAVPTN